MSARKRLSHADGYLSDRVYEGVRVSDDAVSVRKTERIRKALARLDSGERG